MLGLKRIEPRTKPEFQSLKLASVVKFTMAIRAYNNTRLHLNRTKFFADI
jgi:hypothetical protein